MSCVFRCTAATSLFENPSLLERDERAGDVERDFAVGGHLLRSNQDSMASTEPRVISLDHLLSSEEAGFNFHSMTSSPRDLMGSG